MNKFVLVVCSLFAALPASAQNVQRENSGLQQMIDESEGYVNIRDNVVMVEVDGDVKACHFGLTPEFFAAHASGDETQIEASKPDVACVSLLTFAVNETASGIDSPTALYQFIDTSEAYLSIAPNIVMVEGDYDIQFCHFDMSDTFFAAAAASDTEAMVANQPSVTCIPFEAIR